MIQAGSNSLSGIYVGGTAISAVFVGSTKVWPNTPLSPYTMLTKVSFNDSQNSSNYNVYNVIEKYTRIEFKSIPFSRLSKVIKSVLDLDFIF